MAQSFSCKCEERKKPIQDRAWVVLAYKSRCSAFDGYRTMSSDWSEVGCLRCRARGRTKARYVGKLVRDRGHYEAALYGRLSPDENWKEWADEITD